MKKVKNILIGLLVFSIIALCFIFNGPLVTEASSDDENSRPYTQLKNTTSDPETIYSDKYQKNIYQQIKKIKQINNYTLNLRQVTFHCRQDSTVLSMLKMPLLPADNIIYIYIIIII